jgi:hypothetical protein
VSPSEDADQIVVQVFTTRARTVLCRLLASVGLRRAAEWVLRPVARISGKDYDLRVRPKAEGGPGVAAEIERRF